MRPNTDKAKARAATVAMRHFAAAVFVWFRAEGDDGIVAGRNRGGVLVIAATGRYAEDVEAVLTRERVIEEVQDDYPAHLQRRRKPDWTRKERHSGSVA